MQSLTTGKGKLQSCLEQTRRDEGRKFNDEAREEHNIICLWLLSPTSTQITSQRKRELHTESTRRRPAVQVFMTVKSLSLYTFCKLDWLSTKNAVGRRHLKSDCRESDKLTYWQLYLRMRSLTTDSKNLGKEHSSSIWRNARKNRTRQSRRSRENTPSIFNTESGMMIHPSKTAAPERTSERTPETNEKKTYSDQQ